MEKILIIGGTGSWGQELTKQLLDSSNIDEIRIYSRGEHQQVEMARKFNSKKLKFIIGDIRDKNSLLSASKGVDTLFHLAALKHVPICEHNPDETIKTNINGTLNAVEVAFENNIKTFVLVSTDKAVDPINVYGVSKSMAEKIVVNANLRSSNTKFVCIRGGNVLGTNGSVVPLFKNQISRANSITITDANMTRYLMTLKEAISLIFNAIKFSKGGEIFVMKMPSVKILHLANLMISELGNNETIITTIGIRPGEKIHEVLVSKYEAPRTYDFNDYYVVLPYFNIEQLSVYYSNQIVLEREYNSSENQFLSDEELKKLLNSEGWLSKTKKDSLDNYTKEELLEYFKREKWIE